MCLYVQIGTACVTRGQDSRLALGRLGALVEQIETLVRGGREVILVTSGTLLLVGLQEAESHVSRRSSTNFRKEHKF